ncbi:hypothetical protein LCGC14_1016770 [marine sediment metagenome]|uniref:Uncharacterized protein n=1 Tax=marine sediment metagenome TaxID=412755 RepID=A0A0F9NKB3_9ZZZZ
MRLPGVPNLATNNLTDEMIQFENETGKNAVYRGKVTGQFDYWLNWSKRNKKHKKWVKKVQKSKIRITSKKNIKKVKPRIVIKVPPNSICYEKKRRGTESKPVVESYLLNEKELKYNWTEGQLYINNKPLGLPDSKYSRDMLLYAKQNKPHVSIDKLRNWWVTNYDMAIKNNWEDCAISIKKFLEVFGLTV